MSKTFDINSYVTVQERIHIFWNMFRDGRIVTEMIHIDASKHTARMVIIKAKVFKDRTNRSPDATGFAKEREGTRGANETALIENCETSAIGRALANLNIAATKNRPSQEEMLAVQSTEAEHQKNIGLLTEYASSLEEEDDVKRVLRKQWGVLKHSPIEAFKWVQTLDLDTQQESEESQEKAEKTQAVEAV